MWISCARGVSDIREQDSYLCAMLPPPPIRGLFRTDHRARAAYAEGAGIFRILPLAVCLPRRPRGSRLAGALGRQRTGCRWCRARRRQRDGRRQRGRGRRGGPHRVAAPTRRRRPARAGPRDQRQRHAGRDQRRGRAARPPAAARSVQRPWATLGGMVSTNAAGRAHGALRQRAPLGRRRVELVTAARRGDRAPARPARGGARSHGRSFRGRGGAGHPAAAPS